MDDLLTMYDNFPLLVPSKEFKFWEGFVIVSKEEVLIRVSVPSYPSLKDISVTCSKELKYLFTSNSNYSELPQDCSLTTFLKQLLTVQQSRSICPLLSSDICKEKMFYKRYNFILSEIKKSVGMENVRTLSKDLTDITLQLSDDNNRLHTLRINFSDNYPQTSPDILDVDLPETSTSDLFRANTLEGIVQHFKLAVSSLQKFWDACDELNIKALVVDPEQPKKKDVHRRVVVSNSISILLILNPLDIATCPDITFLGPERAVASIRKIFEVNLKKNGWNDDLNLVENLLELLEMVEFPKTVSNAKDFEDQLFVEGECCICFTTRTDEQQLLPSKVCNNDKCSSCFHLDCLAQWLQSVATNEPSFGFISGDCPNCGEKLLCPVKMI